MKEDLLEKLDSLVLRLEKNKDQSIAVRSAIVFAGNFRSAVSAIQEGILQEEDKKKEVEVEKKK